MIRILTFFTLFLLFSTTLTGQITLTIEINGLENNSGQIILKFTDGANKQIKALNGKISNKKCLFTINDLKPGKYAFKYFHDENNNEKMDTNWLGIPKEGYGFSNDAKGIFGPPDFEDTIFEIKSDTIFTCSPRYL